MGRDVMCSKFKHGRACTWTLLGHLDGPSSSFTRRSGMATIKNKASEPMLGHLRAKVVRTMTGPSGLKGCEVVTTVLLPGEQSQTSEY